MKLLFTGGVGDLITIESFMSQTEKDSVTDVYLACRSVVPVKHIIETYQLFPNNKSIKVFYDKWDDFFSFVDFNHLKQLNIDKNLNLNIQELEQCKDMNIINVFPEINSFQRRYYQSSLIKKAPAVLPCLPSKYGVINPYSSADRQEGRRDFKVSEWNNVIKNIEKLNIPFVVVNKTTDYVPIHPLLVNLSNQTDIVTSIEIIKNAMWYIGIDSWMPALLSKILNHNNLVVKTMSGHYVQYLHIYLYPHINFSNVLCGLDYFKL